MNLRSAGRLALVFTMALLIVSCGDDATSKSTTKQPLVPAPTTTSATPTSVGGGTVASTSTTEPTTTSTTEAPPVRGIDRERPVPAGESAEVGDWLISVTGSTPNGTEAVLAENQFNDPPASGNQFFLVSIAATYLGAGSEAPFAGLSFSAVGDTAVAYSFDSSCGVVPGGFPTFVEAYPGGTIEGNLCWDVDPSDASSLVLIVDAAFSFSDERRFFEVPLDGTTYAPVTVDRPAIESGDIGSRGSPHPVGTEVQVGDWLVAITSWDPDATAVVGAENQFNDPPSEGHRFVMVGISATFEGSGSEAPFAGLTFSAVAASSVAYGSSEASCGVIPDDFPSFTEVFSGGTVNGNLCWEIRDSDVTSLLVAADPAFSLDGDRQFFSPSE